MRAGCFQKEPYDEFQVRLSYDDVLQDGETLSSVTLFASLVSDEVDLSSTLLASTTASLVTGTATGGSTTTMIDTAKNFANEGIKPGDQIYNSTKKWVATVKSLTSTTNLFDTVTFDAQASAAAGSDTYYFGIAKASVKGGESGNDYQIRFRALTSATRKFEDSVTMQVRDS